MGVDVGGTFTDLVALGPRGLVAIKVPSTPDAPERGIWDAYDNARLSEPPETLIHGTTVATNALLERKGAKVVLVTTAGFEDLLELRRQDRAALYDLARHQPPPLVPRARVVGVKERMGPDGPVLQLTEAALNAAVEAVRALGPEAVAVSLLFAFRHPEHERRLALALRARLPGIPIATAHELVPRVREYERTSTVSAEAFLRPRVGSYVERFASDAAARRIAAPRMLASNGGALPPDLAASRAVWLALSGPAGGIQGAALVGAASGAADLLTIDMGGTSADAGVVIAGEANVAAHGAVAGVPLAVPHIAIETVSAGGGSIGWLDSGNALRVGPHSAGAQPGPACYGRGGTEPTVTDAFLVLGWIPDGAVLGGSVKVRRDLAERAVTPLAKRAGLDVQTCALGMIAVAEATIARALRRVSVERGLDPAGLTLVAFGGAGPLCGCALAGLIGARRVLLRQPGPFPPKGAGAGAQRLELGLPARRLQELVEEWPASIKASQARVRDRRLVRQHRPFGRLGQTIVVGQARFRAACSRVQVRQTLVRCAMVRANVEDLLEQPVEIALDPDVRLWRRLGAGEAPPILRQAMLDPSTVTVLPGAPAPALESARMLAAKLLDYPPHIRSDAERAAGVPLLVIGLDGEVDRWLASQQLPAMPDVLRSRGSAVVWTASLP